MCSAGAGQVTTARLWLTSSCQLERGRDAHRIALLFDVLLSPGQLVTL
jgi:hypothetical protein